MNENDNWSITPEALKEIEQEEKIEKRYLGEILRTFGKWLSRPVYQYLRLHTELRNDENAYFLYHTLRKQVLEHGLSLMKDEDDSIVEKIQWLDRYHDIEIKCRTEEIEQYRLCTYWLLNLLQEYQNFKETD